jgi:hypothetical protein
VVFRRQFIGAMALRNGSTCDTLKEGGGRKRKGKGMAGSTFVYLEGREGGRKEKGKREGDNRQSFNPFIFRV